MQGWECCVSNEIIYLWKPTPAPGPKPIYQVWAAGGSSPGTINLPPVSPPVLHHAPLPLVSLLGLIRPPFLLVTITPHATRRRKATAGSGGIIQIRRTRDTVTNLCSRARLFVRMHAGLTSGRLWVTGRAGDAAARLGCICGDEAGVGGDINCAQVHRSRLQRLINFCRWDGHGNYSLWPEPLKLDWRINKNRKGWEKVLRSIKILMEGENIRFEMNTAMVFGHLH